MIKLKDILREIGQPTEKDAYPLTNPEHFNPEPGTKEPYKGQVMINNFKFTNRKGDDMSIEVNFDTNTKDIYVVFYNTLHKGEKEWLSPDEEEIKYGDKTGSGDMVRVLATVVEAVRRTLKFLEKEKKETVRDINILAYDDKRFQIYMPYIENLLKKEFSNFTLFKIGKLIRLKNKNYKREVTEIFDTKTGEKYDLVQVKPKKKKGEEEVKPEFGPTSTHSYSDGSVQNEYTWTYTNVKGQKMDITIYFEKKAGGMYPTLFISFGKAGKISHDQDKWKVMTGANDLNIILNTVIDSANKIVEKEVKNQDGLFAVGFEPADERRKNVYAYYIKKNFSNFEYVKDVSADDRFDKDQRRYEWYVNKNYEA
jgi:hypothetical protein